MVNVSEGKTLTLTNFQMKLFTSIASTAAVIGASLISTTPAKETLNGKRWDGKTQTSVKP